MFLFRKRNLAGKILFILIQLIMLLSLYSAYRFCWPYLINTIVNNIIYFTLPISLGFMLVALYKASYTDPGYMNGITPSKIIVQLNEQYQNTCDKCKCWKAPRAHHCKRCRKCVFKMDHHCEWINNCVGVKNQKYFILFLIYTLIYVLQVLWIHGFAIIMWSMRQRRLIDELQKITKGKVAVFSIVLMCFFFIIFVSTMLHDQVQVLIDNQSTVESHKDIAGRSQSFTFSFKQVFGEEKRYWFLPTKPKILSNYAELAYDVQYAANPNSIFLEDMMYDKSGQFYSYFQDLQLN